MSRRANRRQRFLSFAQPDPFVMGGASRAWRAEDSANDGSNTTSLPPYIGSLTLVKNAAGQAVKSASANFGGKAVVPFLVAGNRAYSGSFAVPAAMTVISVWRISATNAGLHAITVSDAVNTGNSCYLDLGNISAQKLAVPLAQAQAVPIKLVSASVFTAAGITHYVNSLTPTSSAVVGALTGDKFTLGAITAVGTYVATGEWRKTAQWDRALSNAEVGAQLAVLGTQEGIVIAP